MNCWVVLHVRVFVTLGAYTIISDCAKPERPFLCLWGLQGIAGSNIVPGPMPLTCSYNTVPGPTPLTRTSHAFGWNSDRRDAPALSRRPRLVATYSYVLARVFACAGLKFKLYFSPVCHRQGRF